LQSVCKVNAKNLDKRDINFIFLNVLREINKVQPYHILNVSAH